jgi:hypothetical protein
MESLIFNYFFKYKVYADFCAFLRFTSCAYLIYCLFHIRKDAWNFSRNDSIFNSKSYKDFCNFHYIQISLFNYFESALAQKIIFICFFVFGIFSAIGLLTNISIFIFLVCLVSIQSRIFPIIFNGGDSIARLLVLCLLLTDCGSKYSIDNLIGISTNHEQVDGWAIRLFQINIVFIYFWSSLYKLNDAFWTNGTAVRNAVASKLWGKRIAIKYLSIPIISKTLAYSVLIFEYFAPILLLVPDTRIVASFFAVLMHLGICIFMRIGYFGPIMVISAFSFMNSLFK